jgi:hypothetical protein
MNERANGAIIDLAQYRQRILQQQQRNGLHRDTSDALLDTISYHILMAARAIAASKTK